MFDRLVHLAEEASSALEAAADGAALALWRSQYLGRRGKLTEAVRALGLLLLEILLSHTIWRRLP